MKVLESNFENKDNVIISATTDELLWISNALKYVIVSTGKRFNTQFYQNIADDLEKILSKADIEKRIIEGTEK